MVMLYFSHKIARENMTGYLRRPPILPLHNKTTIVRQRRRRNMTTGIMCTEFRQVALIVFPFMMPKYTASSQGFV